MKITVIMPSNSEALFNKNSERAFGGGDVQMYQISKELGRRSGVECYTFIQDYDVVDFDERDKFQLVNTFKKSDNLIVKFWKYHKCLKKVQPDAVLQQGLTFFSALLSVYCKAFGIAFIFLFAHDNEAEGRYQENAKKSPVFKLLLNSARLLISQNIYQKEQLLNRYGKETIIMRNGFYLKENIKLHGDYVLWVARHSRWKRPEFFIDLAEMNPNLNFKMVCPPSFADNYEELVKKAVSVENLEFISFVSFDKIDSHFEDAKIFVNTSDYEGFPQTFIHAAMNAVPVLSLSVNPDKVLTDGEFGFYCHGSLKVLNEKLNALCFDEGLYRKMADNALLYAEESHDIKRNVSMLLGLLSQCKTS